MKTKAFLHSFLFICTLAATLLNMVSAQKNSTYMRIARIVVDSGQLDNYKTALKEGMETAVRVEPGVISLYAVFDKEHPTHITVFETYASIDAYHHHIETAHFKKYKETVKDMVKSLDLADVEPIALEKKEE